MSAVGNADVSAALFSWPTMSEDRYAALEQATGINVVKVGPIWWRRPRAFLYRPLLPFKKYDVRRIKDFNRIGIFQTAVDDGCSSNSYLNPIVYEKPQEYGPRKLRDSARKNLNKALRNFISVRFIVDEEEFSEVAYPVYLSFYRRTQYRFDTSRKHRAKFRQWAHSLFQFPEALILGAFLGRDLVSFEIACRVEDTLVLKTLVTSDQGIKVNAPDILLHCYRSMAREQFNINLIYDSLLSPNNGLNDYKIRRGAQVKALPAAVHIHPGFMWLIKKINSAAYARLRGFSGEQLLAQGFVSRRQLKG